MMMKLLLMLLMSDFNTFSNGLEGQLREFNGGCCLTIVYPSLKGSVVETNSRHKQQKIQSP